jgi:hypothetical protein
MGPEPHSELERVWHDNVKREHHILHEHPEWTIKRDKPEDWPKHPVTYEATDGTVTLRSQDLGALLDLVERAMRDVEG